MLNNSKHNFNNKVLNIYKMMNKKIILEIFYCSNLQNDMSYNEILSHNIL